MEMTTIAVTKDLRNRISEFGNKGETFSEVLERLLKSAEQRLLHDVLFDPKGCVLVKDALERAKSKWQ